jgi:hypothetical protein
MAGSVDRCVATRLISSLIAVDSDFGFPMRTAEDQEGASDPQAEPERTCRCDL